MLELDTVSLEFTTKWGKNMDATLKERSCLFCQSTKSSTSWRSRYKRRRYRGCRAACWFCGSPGLLPAPGSSGHLYSNPRINSSKSTSGSFSSVDGPSRHLDRARVWGGLCESFRGVLCRLKVARMTRNHHRLKLLVILKEFWRGGCIVDSYSERYDGRMRSECVRVATNGKEAYCPLQVNIQWYRNEPKWLILMLTTAF